MQNIEILIMQNVEELKLLVKEKWLDYYEINQGWIVTFTNANKYWVDCSSGGSRPHALIILGAITSSDPRITDWMTIFCQLQSNANELIKVLELDFDPDEAIKIRIQQREEQKECPKFQDLISCCHCVMIFWLNPHRNHPVQLHLFHQISQKILPTRPMTHFNHLMT